MINRLSEKISSALMGENADSDEVEICTYGVESALYTMISTAGLLLIGFAAGLFMPTCMLVMIYYGNQTAGGGYHASTHISCFVTMACGLLVCILAVHFRLLRIFMTLVLAVMSGVYLLIRPLHLHVNKEYLLFQKERLVHRSRIVILCSLLIVVLMYQYNSGCFQMSALGLVCSAISRYVSFRKSANKTELINASCQSD